MFESGAVLRWHVEYANTNCKFYSPTVDFELAVNCAYRQSIFTAGYRYQDRNIGHTVDAESETTSLGATWQAANGHSFGFRLQRAILDRYNGVDPYNPLTRGPGEHREVELSWAGRLAGQDLSLQLGLAQHDAGTGSLENRAFGFVQWRKAL